MTREVSFQTRARTIDHLGRGQIADAPTAVSELWKNAYDAYASRVSLHVFSGAPAIAAIFDDGFGMCQRDLLERWLVIGTESKVEDALAGPDTLGLKHRPRQGEKGIGRLSAAFLAPATILLSKQLGGGFAALLVDWRLFENPFLALQDVRLPVAEFDTADEVLEGLTSMVEVLLSNLEPGPDGSDDEGRVEAWRRYAAYELKLEQPQTAEAIRRTWSQFPLGQRHLEEWPVFVGLADHGTAMFLVGVNRELDVLVRPSDLSTEAKMVKDDLRETLIGFTDPFAEPRPDFDYEVWAHHADGANECVISADAVFGAGDFAGLEHSVEGVFDESGVFSGRVVAFGRDLGIQSFVPREPPPSSPRDRVGSFRFCIGTFEQELRRSTHDEQVHAGLMKKAEQFGGINVYRDDLRVMPYGREDADFLGIEARRGRHAGRYFWAHRRSFGRIAFRRGENPNLRDKAGREGLVDNRARRELRRIVTDLLVDFAARFFGTDSSYRKDLLPEIMARNAAAKAAADKARTNRRKGIRQFLREQQAPLDDALQRLESLQSLAESVRESGDQVEATVMQSRYHDMLAARDGLRPPVVASKLGELEADYRAYRDGYSTFTERLSDLGRVTAEVEAVVGTMSPAEALERSFARHEETLGRRLDAYDSSIGQALGQLGNRWRETITGERSEYRRRFSHYMSGQLESQGLLAALNLLDAGRAEMEEEFAGRYPPLLRALQQLRDGIDLDSAFAATEDDRAELEDRLRDLHTVAQVGVTVEILGHELESLEGEVRRNLGNLPTEVRASTAFQRAMHAHVALAERLRFLSPMKVAGYRARETITGADIADYVGEFFEKVFRDQRIDFTASAAFRDVRIVDIPARIYPVFLNLVNNAVYWVSQREERRIRLDFVDGKVVIADSGPGVDRDDVPSLFDLFFTRRSFGRGVGLYLSRANLALGNHRIRYATAEDPKVLDGANFIIEFRGVEPQ
ncbi:ATP-binding protein [Phenylobacterium sp.]|uniref:ATP-binding protein n=1 Tax=Phenylobacterium sp. TaxID=1871053 RepID=UPI00272F1864|nr:ATP-binding protein [Phenylobacterium sp.]MDP1874832.1 ATP-binding protein [Phenylobacterium sp.]